jgi:hypothetical protein
MKCSFYEANTGLGDGDDSFFLSSSGVTPLWFDMNKAIG